MTAKPDITRSQYPSSQVLVESFAADRNQLQFDPHLSGQLVGELDVEADQLTARVEERVRQ